MILDSKPHYKPAVKAISIILVLAFSTSLRISRYSSGSIVNVVFLEITTIGALEPEMRRDLG